MTLNVREAEERAKEVQQYGDEPPVGSLLADDYLALLDLARRLAERLSIACIWGHPPAQCVVCSVLAKAREAGLLEEKP